MKLFTPVTFDCPEDVFSGDDKIVFMGSCFATAAGTRMKDAGFDVMVNPFGALYNPISICNAVSRLRSGIGFTEQDCVRMGAGADKICSFYHHTSFARDTEAEFLDNANRALKEASGFWKEASVAVITLGTAACWQRNDTGEVVANCLKRPSGEFTRKMLDVGRAAAVLKSLVAACAGKKVVFTVSPIRHLGEGAHRNQLSKSILLLATEEVCKDGRALYFPSYEIMMDELRDYRFYDPGMTHPTAQAEDYIMERFLEWGLHAEDRAAVQERQKEALRSRHRPILPQG